MTKRCFVSNCPTGRKSCKEKASIFKAPSDERLLQKWRQVVPQNGRMLMSTDHICEKHFESRFIVPRFLQIKEDYYQDFIRPKLVQNAVPTIFPKVDKAVIHQFNKLTPTIPKSSLHPAMAPKSTTPSNAPVSIATLIEREIINGIEVKETDYIPICFKCLTEKSAFHTISRK